jgi:methionine-rich copper-binding protein CopC
MSTRTTQAVPSAFTMSVQEKLTLNFDMSPLLNSADSEVLADVETKLVNGTTRAVVPLTDDPTHDTSTIDQTVDGAELVAGITFRLEILFTAVPSTNRWLVELSIVTIP